MGIDLSANSKWKCIFHTGNIIVNRCKRVRFKAHPKPKKKMLTVLDASMDSFSGDEFKCKEK